MGVSSPAIIPLFSLWFQFVSEKEKFPASPRPSFPSSPSSSFSFHHSLVIRCKKRKIIDRFQMEEQRRRRGAPAALTTSTAPNEMLRECFFFPSPSGREGLQSAPWGSSLYSSHPSLRSLPVYSTCHLPSLPWRRLHMLPTEGGTREEEEVRTRVEERRGGYGRREERRGEERRRKIRGGKMSLQLIKTHAEP